MTNQFMQTTVSMDAKIYVADPLYNMDSSILNSHMIVHSKSFHSNILPSLLDMYEYIGLYSGNNYDNVSNDGGYCCRHYLSDKL